MNKLYILLILATSIVLCSCATDSKSKAVPYINTSNINSITVIVIPSEHIDSRRVEHIFFENLINKGYILTSRSDLDIVLKELKIQRSGITASSAAEIGKIMNVDAVLISSVTEFSKQKHSSSNESYLAEAVIDARLLNVETANLMWVSSRSFRSNLFSQLGSVIRDPIVNPPWNIIVNTGNRLAPLVYELAEEFPNKSKT